MDPASILGVASAAITFLDFAIKLVKGSHEVYCSLDGSTEENAHVDLVISDLQSAAATLPRRASSRDRIASQNDKALEDLGVKCHEKCIELLTITQKLKTHQPTKWSSFKTAWKGLWKKEAIDHMHAQLRDYRLAILLRLNQMQIENDIQADAKLDAILREFRRPIRDEYHMEATICSRITDQLYFKSIYNREDGISNPERGTFDWITDQSKDYSTEDEREYPAHIFLHQREARCDARSKYLSWLGHGAEATQSGAPETAPPSPRILHISGKAGSGKSTLMRHLFRHEKTRSALEKWAGTGTLVLASFYFWVASGDDMQKSLQGLYRKILHDVLLKCPELAVYLFPSQWQAIQGSLYRNEEAKDSADAVLFRDEAIRDAFSKLTGPAASGSHTYFFCFFIDGLDEYRERALSGGGDRKDLSSGFKKLARELLRWNKATHIKFCTTSRPHNEFLDPLHRNEATVLHLDGLNQCDIYRYCRTTFEEDDDLAEMRSSYVDLVPRITGLAEGVFLWAVLVTQALITSLSRGDSMEVQLKKLVAMPSELNDLYTMLLGRADEDDQRRTNRLFFIVLSCEEILYPRKLMVHWASYLDNVDDADFPLSLPKGLTLEKHKDRGRRLINSLTHGLLTIDEFGQVLFLHRTAYDYMREREARGQLTSGKIDFDQIDVFGRFKMTDYLYGDENHYRLIDNLSSYDHQNRADTYARIADMMRRHARRKHQSEHPDATTYPLPIVASIRTITCCASILPITVDDESVPTIEVSILCYVAVMAMRERVRDRFFCINFRPPFLTEEDHIALDFFSICALAQDSIKLEKRLWDGFVQHLRTLDLTTRSIKLGNQHHSYSAFIALCLANMWLRALMDAKSTERLLLLRAQDLTADGTVECKVTLNDRMHTVTTLKHMVNVLSMRGNDYFGHDKTSWLKLSPEERLDRVAAYMSTEEPTENELYSDRDERLAAADGQLGAEVRHSIKWRAGWRALDELDSVYWEALWLDSRLAYKPGFDKMDVKMYADKDDRIDWVKMWTKIYIRSVEVEGQELDSGFRLYFAVPDLYKEGDCW